MCHVLPDSVSLEDGAMMEPLSVGVHAVSTLGQFKSNQTVVVFGAGPVGLLSMAVAKGLGARRVIAVDINQQRLDFAKGYAATDIFTPVSPKPSRLLLFNLLSAQKRTRRGPQRLRTPCSLCLTRPTRTPRWRTRRRRSRNRSDGRSNLCTNGRTPFGSSVLTILPHLISLAHHRLVGLTSR